MDRIRRISEIVGLTLEETTELLALTSHDAELSSEDRTRVATVLELAEILEEKLNHGIVPAVFRRPAPAYGGQSLLEMVRFRREAEALAIVRRSFDWSGTA